MGSQSVIMWVSCWLSGVYIGKELGVSQFFVMLWTDQRTSFHLRKSNHTHWHPHIVGNMQTLRFREKHPMTYSYVIDIMATNHGSWSQISVIGNLTDMNDKDCLYVSSCNFSFFKEILKVCKCSSMKSLLALYIVLRRTHICIIRRRLFFFFFFNVN